MKLGVKLALLLLALSTIPILVSSYLGYITARDNLTLTVMNQLTGIRRSKGSEVESYFRTAFNEIKTMGETRLIASALDEFRNAFAKLEGQKIPARLEEPVTRYYRDA